eukprot:3047869-Prymnesium_polylepis.1
MQDFMKRNPDVLSKRIASVIRRKHLEASAAVYRKAEELEFPTMRPDASDNFFGKGRLHVYVRRASGLRAADMAETSDPYAVLELKGQEHRTRVIKRTLNPPWDDHFVWAGDMASLARDTMTVK